MILAKAGTFAAFALFCAAAPVRADVLEIGGDGASWVAGGPRVPAPVTYAASAAPIDGPAAAQASLTEVDAGAGPQDWRGRVAGEARPGSGLALTLAADF